MDHKCSFFCVLGLSAATLFMQFLMIERSSLPIDWLQSKSDDETKMGNHNFKDMQKVTDVMDEGEWSKSSSMSTINLRDQPVIFEKESESNYNHCKNDKNYTVYRLMTSFHLLSLLYQMIILSIVIGALEV